MVEEGRLLPLYRDGINDGGFVVMIVERKYNIYRVAEEYQIKGKLLDC